MTASRFFCAQSSCSRGDSLFGTAPHVERWILLEHPRGWSSKGFPDDRLPPSVQAHLAALTHQVPRSRPLLIRQSHSLGEQLQCFLAHSRERGSDAVRVDLSDYEALLKQEPQSFGEQPRARIWTDPLYLVCTHGKHDKCCAKYGHATYKAFRAQAGSAVWESSHVGGDRFAANVVCLPHGIYYGHVFPEDVSALVSAHQAGRLSLRHFRGRSCHSRVPQIGEYFVRSESGLAGIDDLALLDSEVLQPDKWRVRFSSTGSTVRHTVEFKSRPSGNLALLTCKAGKPQPITGYELSNYSAQ